MSLRRACFGLMFLGFLGVSLQADLKAQESPTRHTYIQVPAGTLGDPSVNYHIINRRPVPPLVTAEPQRGKALVSWKKAEDPPCAASPWTFKLFRSVAGEPLSEIVLASGREKSYLDQGLEAGVEVCYVIRSVSQHGHEGPDSEPACVVPLPESLPLFIRGDADQSGHLNITDPIRVLNFMFRNPDEVVRSCLDAAETNDNGILDISDPVYLLNFLMAGGPAPRPPFPACGLDPTEDQLECAGSPAC